MGVMPSVGSVGDAYDNAMAESFFATLECELLDRRCFRTQAEAKLAVFEYIEGFYNVRRRHSSLGYRSPIRFEKEMANGKNPQPLLPLNAADRAWSKPVRVRKEGGGEHQIRSCHPREGLPVH